MRVLDRSLFTKDIQLSAARVPDTKRLSRVRNALHKTNDILTLRLVSPIKLDPADTQQKLKCILLNPAIKHDGAEDLQTV